MPRPAYWRPLPGCSSDGGGAVSAVVPVTCGSGGGCGAGSGAGGGGGGGAAFGLQTSLSSTLLPSWICSVLACAVAYETFDPVGSASRYLQKYFNDSTALFSC